MLLIMLSHISFKLSLEGEANPKGDKHMTEQDKQNEYDQFVDFAREEQRIYGHTGLDEDHCPAELLATDKAFCNLSPEHQRQRKQAGVVSLNPAIAKYFPQ